MATGFLFYDPQKKNFFLDKLCFFSANLTNFAILEIKIHQISNVTKLKKKKKKKPSMIWFLNKKMVLIFN
jgi:hypothetical protein